MLTRRHVLLTGGSFLLAGSLPLRLEAAAETVEIRMQGNADGSKVWFDPIGVLVQPGQTIRWTNRDPGNAHTTTTYHPANSGHVHRIPEGAEPWNSDYLLPNETFALTLTVEGVYDYFCIPHEMAGMVGRIVVGHPVGAGAKPFEGTTLEAGVQAVPEAARRAFPTVQDIVRRGVVHQR